MGFLSVRLPCAVLLVAPGAAAQRGDPRDESGESKEASRGDYTLTGLGVQRLGHTCEIVSVLTNLFVLLTGAGAFGGTVWASIYPSKHWSSLHIIVCLLGCLSLCGCMLYPWCLEENRYDPFIPTAPEFALFDRWSVWNSIRFIEPYRLRWSPCSCCVDD